MFLQFKKLYFNSKCTKCRVFSNKWTKCWTFKYFKFIFIWFSNILIFEMNFMWILLFSLSIFITISFTSFISFRSKEFVVLIKVDNSSSLVFIQACSFISTIFLYFLSTSLMNVISFLFLSVFPCFLYNKSLHENEYILMEL